ncbi:hypothetical protein D3C72_2152080 [compost metagenome]
MVHHAAFLAVQNLHIAQKSAGYYLNAYLKIIRNIYLHIADEGADVDLCLAWGNLRLRKIKNGIPDKMRYVKRLEIPVIVPDMDVANKA